MSEPYARRVPAPMPRSAESYQVGRDTFCATHQAWIAAQPPRAACACRCPGPGEPALLDISAVLIERCDCACHFSPVPRDAAVVYYLMRDPAFSARVVNVGAAEAFRAIGCPGCYAGAEPIQAIEEGGL